MRNQPLNIILIMTDQQRYDTINALGAGWMCTPNLDRLVREGVSLDSCFCTAPSCVPARASFFNGRYPHSLDVLRNIDRWEHSWVEQLAGLGYHCVNVGKMHTVPFDAPCGFHERYPVENKDRPLRPDANGNVWLDEWDKFLAAEGQRKPNRHTYREDFADHADALGAFEWPLAEKYHSDVFVGDMALRRIDDCDRDAPVFLQIGFPGPHPPFDPTRRFIEMYEDADIPLPELTDGELAAQPSAQRAYREVMVGGNHDAIMWKERPDADALLRMRRHYAANTTMIDEKLGQILARLEARGMLEDAVVVFTSDHGDCLGDHGHIQKWTMYDAVTRVPTIAWSPGRFPAGRRVDALTQAMDLGAALVELAGGRLETGQVASALPLLTGESDTGRDAVFSEHIHDNIMKGADYISMVRTCDWKLVHYLDQDEGELYDLRADPAEVRNLWADPAHRAQRDALILRLLDWRVRTGIAHKPEDNR